MLSTECSDFGLVIRTVPPSRTSQWLYLFQLVFQCRMIILTDLAKSRDPLTSLIESLIQGLGPPIVKKRRTTELAACYRLAFRGSTQSCDGVLASSFAHEVVECDCFRSDLVLNAIRRLKHQKCSQHVTEALMMQVASHVSSIDWLVHRTHRVPENDHTLDWVTWHPFWSSRWTPCILSTLSSFDAMLSAVNSSSAVDSYNVMYADLPNKLQLSTASTNTCLFLRSTVLLSQLSMSRRNSRDSPMITWRTNQSMTMITWRTNQYIHSDFEFPWFKTRETKDQLTVEQTRKVSSVCKWGLVFP